MKTRANLAWVLSVAMMTSSCLSAELSREVVEAPVVLGLFPDVDVAPDAPVSIVLTRPVVRGQEGDWPLEVRRFDGREVEVEAAFGPGAAEVLLTPVPAWPAGERLEVRISKGLKGTSGRPLVLPPGPMSFATRAHAPEVPAAVVRAPIPGQTAALDLLWLLIASEPPLPEVMEEVQLVSGDHSVTARVWSRVDGRVLLRLPEYRGPCSPLCPDTTYAVELPAGVPRASGPVGEVKTASIADLVRPTVLATRVMTVGDRVLLDVDADEVILARAETVADPPVRFVARLMAARQLRLEPETPLAPNARHLVRVEVEDLAGRMAEPFDVVIDTPPRVRVRISEVVASPIHDWSDSAGGGVPFDGQPGTGAVNDNDEWIELINESDHPLDLDSAGLELLALDGAPSVTFVRGAPALYFGDGGDLRHWWPGEALVVRPRGALSQRDLVLELRSGTVRLDRITLGDGPEADHVGGAPPDTVHEALARDLSGRVRWCRPSPGDPLPPTDCVGPR